MEANAIILKTSNYKVATPVYQGPLDLLLQLIERSELDITKVALAEVTKPFLAYVKDLENRQAEEVSGFLIIAARLMQIKSEALLPRPPEREIGEEDPGDALIQQLVIYKRYKVISQILWQRERDGLKSYLRIAPTPKVESKLDMSGVTLNDLIKAASRIYSEAAEKHSLGSVVRAPRVTISEKIKHITWTLKSSGRSTFRNLLTKKFSRIETVVTFLAVLELIKIYRIKASQDDLFGEIEIEPTEQWNDGEELELEFIE